MPKSYLFISTIILAAGESTRMGKTKQLLPFADSTIIEQVQYEGDSYIISRHGRPAAAVVPVP